MDLPRNDSIVFDETSVVKSEKLACVEVSVGKDKGKGNVHEPVHFFKDMFKK